ncbi:hypothetical protein IKS38_00490 [bacterium]|nr:hypothetical protein [bacterium]
MKKALKYAANIIQLLLIIVLGLSLIEWKEYSSWMPLRWISCGLLFFLFWIFFFIKEKALSFLLLLLCLLKLPIQAIKLKSMTHTQWNILDISLIVFFIILLLRSNCKTSGSDHETPKEIQEQK